MVETIISFVPEYVFEAFIGTSVSVMKMFEHLRGAAMNIYKIKKFKIMYRIYVLYDGEAKQ